MLKTAVSKDKVELFNQKPHESRDQMRPHWTSIRLRQTERRETYVHEELPQIRDDPNRMEIGVERNDLDLEVKQRRRETEIKMSSISAQKNTF